MSEERVDYGGIKVGDMVIINRHRWVRGDPNWREEMNRYLGQEAKVVRLSGVDSQGCPGVRIDIDGGRFFWRVRDIQKVGEEEEAPFPAKPTVFPQECRQAPGKERYGQATVGAAVMVGRHRPVDGQDNWNDQMDRFVGRRARIVEQVGVDEQGCPGVRIDLDNGQWFWRIRDLRLISGDEAISQGASPLFNEHGRPELPDQGDGGGLF
ncbi:MAG: hypothetical protein NZM37_08740, partial [Sandaracinaceae bacterium]|nr:hypothetical protein [Sandaracinaceae bacterium]